MKIAIVGTGNGWEQAPFNNPEWDVWVIAGLHDRCEPKRVYEIHSAVECIKDKEGFPPQKLEWMKRQNLIIHPSAQNLFPWGVPIDFAKHLNKYGKYFTSSISWMLAEAIEEKPEEIAIFGVGMASNTEYAHQKPGCTYLIGWARSQGIKVSIAQGSELMVAPHIYGMEDPPKFLQDLRVKKAEMRGKMEQFENQSFAARELYNKAQGALEMIEYFENNFWSGSRK